MLKDLLILIAVVGVGWVLWYQFGGGAARRQMQKRIARLHERGHAHKNAAELSLRRKSEENKGLVYWLMKPLPDSKRLGDRLLRAGKTISPKKYMFRRLLSFLAIWFIISVVLGKHVVVGVLIALLLGVALPLKLLSFSIAKHNRAFLKLFPDALDLIVRGLRSGLPVSESMIMVAQEVPEPVGGVFKTISDTMKLGVPLEKALTDMGHKLGMTEFYFFTTSIVLQRETGGNLSEILNNLSEVLRGRFLMRMRIKALSSEARASAMIIGALPFVVIMALQIISPDYMTPLFSTTNGNICAAIASGMMGFGMWTMYRMTQFEI